MINPGELADLQDFVVGEILTDTCEIKRSTISAPDVNGDTVETWDTVSVEPMSCTPHDVQATEQPAGGVALIGEAMWHLRLRANADVNVRDRILQTFPVTRTFEVISIRGPKTREIFRMVVCNLLT